MLFNLYFATGILSFFAVQAGARKVYAIEASSMATHAEVLCLRLLLYIVCYIFNFLFFV